MRGLFPFVVLLPICNAAGTVQLQWSTDEQLGVDPRTYGYDGPWQAVMVDVGDEGGFPMYPGGWGATILPSNNTGGTYSIAKSSTVVVRQIQHNYTDNGWATFFADANYQGKYVYDEAQVMEKSSGISQRYHVVNASISVASSWNFSLANGSTYTAEVGVLGLGSDYYGATSVLERLQDAGTIGSRSFGVHYGSVTLNQAGSLVLGGYEQNRALGNFGVFDFKSHYSSLPTAFLVDVFLGVEKGGTPFGQSGNLSVFTGDANIQAAVDLTNNFGGPKGSATVTFNPAEPYMYLPPGTCENLEKLLPITYDSDIGLFVWNKTDPRLPTVLGSPAYIAFVLADRNAVNTTIKVPLQLLNLTLIPPIVGSPTPYFPCKSYASNHLLNKGYWLLGRSFLQAAFLGVNYNRSIAFLAQAPGPDMDQSVTRAILPGDETLTTNSIDSFGRSWDRFWTPLPDSYGSSTQNDGTGSSVPSLSIGVIVAIAVVGFLALMLITAATFLFVRKKLRRRRDASEAAASPPKEMHGEPLEQRPELDATDAVFEVGEPMAHEIHGESTPGELGEEVVVVEAPIRRPTP